MTRWISSIHPLIIGHRGASADAPENTLAAFQLAQTQGAHGIEFDVQLSADNVPVVIHDDTVDRTTGGGGRVADLPLAALQALDAGDGESIPTLDAVFETCGPDFLYNIEIKSAERDIEARIAATIARHGMNEQTLISSFNADVLRRARKLLPTEIPMALIHVPGYMPEMAGQFEGVADHPFFLMIDEPYIARAAARGQRVHAWTVDDVDVACLLVKRGVHGIITNRPGYLLTAFARGECQP